MRDREGKKVTVKEFFSRWKGGIQKVTPLQQVKISLIGIALVVTGIIVGLVTTFLLGIWWLFIILVGSLILTAMNLLGTLQKLFALQKINKLMEVENEQESTG